MSNKLTLEKINQLILEVLNGDKETIKKEEQPAPVEESQNKSKKDLDKLIEEVILNKNK